MKVKTRFAPSPTGYLHIGGARTAIFNWLYAKRHGGTFLLRIEDTDKERSTTDSINQIIEAMKWLGLDYDEGPYLQTQREDIYRSYIQKLLGEGKAYRCLCSKEELERKRNAMMKSGAKPKYDRTCRDKDIPADGQGGYVVRFKTPLSGETVVEDLLRGEIVFDNAQLDDMIIARSDGSPTYNFCVVVDDAQMGVTDVIRGDDHLANTPRQATLYEALGFEPPRFAHVPMILGKDRKRLSKRHGALSVLEYRDQGILPQALFNYLVRLGWSHGDQEIFSIDELKQLFDLNAVGKSAGAFDQDKLKWLNGEYIKKEPAGALANLVKNALLTNGVEAGVDEIKPLLPMFRERAKTITAMAESMTVFFVDQVTFDEKAALKFLTQQVAKHLTGLAEKLETADFTDPENVESVFRNYIDTIGLKLKDLAQPVRVALTGGTVSPGLFDLMRAMGKDRCLQRIKSAVKYAERDRGA